jgi:hypothetical protein
MRPLYTWAPIMRGAHVLGGARTSPRGDVPSCGGQLSGGARTRGARTLAPRTASRRARMRPTPGAHAGARTYAPPACAPGVGRIQPSFFHSFSSKFLNINLAGPNSRTYTFYVIHCKKILQIVGHTHFEIPFGLFQFCVVLHFHLVLFLFKWMNWCSLFQLKET